MKKQTYEVTGSDEVVVDVCSFCATRDKIEEANHFCYDCGVFGRYICHRCIEYHDKVTEKENHDVDIISGRTNVWRKDIEQLQQEVFEKEREFGQQVDYLKSENKKYRKEIKRLKKVKENQTLDIEDLVQDRNKQYKHFERIRQERDKYCDELKNLAEDNKEQYALIKYLQNQEEEMGIKTQAILREKEAQYRKSKSLSQKKHDAEIHGLHNNIRNCKMEIKRLQNAKESLKSKFEKQRRDLSSDNSNIGADIRRIRKERNKYRATVEELTGPRPRDLSNLSMKVHAGTVNGDGERIFLM